MLFLFHLPILAETGAGSILEYGVSLSDSINSSWDKQWNTIFHSSLYSSINELAGVFAIGSLVFFMIRFFRNMVLEEFGEHFIELLWPIMVILLLANGAYLTSTSTLAMRQVISQASDNILNTTLLEVKLEDAIQNSVMRAAVGGEISAQLSQCEGLVDQPQRDCLEKANAQVQESIQEFQAKTGIPSSFVKLGAAIDTAVREVPGVNGVIGGLQTGTQQNGGPLADTAFGVAGFFGGALNAAVQSIVQILLLAFQWAFANTLQIAMILTGLMGPLAVAGSLLPFGVKSIYVWVIGFFSLGMAQISYNIIVGLCAVVIVNSDITDVNGFLVIVGLLAPALALAIAAGGGLSVFNIITSGTAGMTALMIGRGLPWGDINKGTTI